MKLSSGLGALLTSLAAGSAKAAEDVEQTEKPVPDSLPRRDTDQIETHASGADNTEMLQLARSNKEAFIGKTLFFTNGQEVGPIKDIRRWKRDDELYMVVNAEKFFNEAVDFAVPVGEVADVKDDRVELPEGPGMHLRGMEYHAGDFKDISTGNDVPLIVDE